MSPLDNFFRKKLEERSFPQDDLAWQEMEALLDDQRDRKPRLGWLFFLLGTVMIGAILFVNTTAFGNEAKRITKVTVEDFSRTENEIPDVEEKTIPEVKQERENELIVKEPNDFSNVKNAYLKNNTGSSINSKKSEVKIGRRNSDKVIPSSNGHSGVLDENKIMTSGKKTLSGEVIKKGMPIKLIDSNNDLTPEHHLIDQKITKTAGPKDVAILPTVSPAANKGNIPVEINELAERTAVDVKRIALLTSLPKPLLPIEKTKAAELPGRIKKSPRFALLQLGFRLQQDFIFPVASNSDLRSLAAGPTFNIPIKTTWQLETGLHYRYLAAKTESQQVASISQYSFGLKEYEISSSLSSLHYIGASVFLHKKVGNFKIGLGAEVERLLNIYGTIRQTESLHPWEISSADMPEFTQSVSGRQEIEAETKILISSIAKISYDLRKRTSFWLGIKYQGQPFIRDSTGIVGPLYTESSWQLQAGVAYYIFNWKKLIK